MMPRHYPPRPAQVRNGSTRAWRALRERILKRDGYTCQRCGAPATEVHHRTPVLMGGSDQAANLEALCSPCHKTEQ